jgi:hypothetical protein
MSWEVMVAEEGQACTGVVGLNAPDDVASVHVGQAQVDEGGINKMGAGEAAGFLAAGSGNDGNAQQ